MSAPDAFVAKKLRRDGWPEESLDCYAKTGSRSAVLYPFMRGPVSTPDGPGRLIAAIGGIATVLLNSEERRAARARSASDFPGEGKNPATTDFRVEDVGPPTARDARPATGPTPGLKPSRPRPRRTAPVPAADQGTLL